MAENRPLSPQELVAQPFINLAADIKTVEHWGGFGRAVGLTVTVGRIERISEKSYPEDRIPVRTTIPAHRYGAFLFVHGLDDEETVHIAGQINGPSSSWYVTLENIQTGARALEAVDESLDLLAKEDEQSTVSIVGEAVFELPTFLQHPQEYAYRHTVGTIVNTALQQLSSE